MINRVINQTKFRIIVFSRTPILYLTTYFFPLFSLYFFGKNYVNDTFETNSFMNTYLPLYILIGLSAISVFTVGIDLVSKREKKLYKRIMLIGYTEVESMIADALFSLVLIIPLCLLLLIEAYVLYSYVPSLTNLFIIIPVLITILVFTIISYFVFGLINNSKIAGPLQIAIFGFSLFALGIIMPYSMLSKGIVDFIKLTPYYHINNLGIIFWNGDIIKNTNEIFGSVIYLLFFGIGLSLLTHFIKCIYDNKSIKKLYKK